MRCLVIHAFGMELLVGFALGMLLVMPVGPVAVTLLGVRATHDARSARRAVEGVVIADFALITAAAVLSASLVRLFAGAEQTLTLLIGMILVGLGAWIAMSSHEVLERAAGIHRQRFTLFLLTVGNPLAVLSWVALLAARPLGVTTTSRLLFITGVLLASYIWHRGLTTAGARVQRRFSAVGISRMTTFAGVAVALVGVASIVR